MKDYNREIATNRFFLSTYVPVDVIADVLSRKLVQIKCYAYNTHDKDVYLQDVLDKKTGEIIHRAGDPEIVHTHIYLELHNSRKPSEIISWFRYFDENGVAVNTFKEIPMYSQGCLDYLIHKHNPEKYQYSIESVVSYGFDIQDGSLVAGDDYDFTYDIISDLVAGVPLKTMIKRYGKNFVYHYRQFRDIVDDMLDFDKYGHDFRLSRVSYQKNDDNLPFKTDDSGVLPY